MIEINLKQIVASMVLIYFILIAWNNTYQIGCFSWFIPILITLILASSYIEIKLKEKECYKNCYFKDNTIIPKILMSPYFTSIFFIILSIGYSITLMYDILNYDKWMYVFIIIFIFIVFGIYNYLLNSFSKIINEKHLEIFAREITVKISALVLLIVYIFIYINGYDPEYLESTIEETLYSATNSMSSNCTYIDAILRIKTEIEVYMWFYTKEFDALNSNQNLRVISWIGFIFFNVISILGLNRLIVQIVYLTTKILKDDNGK